METGAGLGARRVMGRFEGDRVRFGGGGGGVG